MICKDCKYFDKTDKYKGYDGVCRHSSCISGGWLVCYFTTCEVQEYCDSQIELVNKTGII